MKELAELFATEGAADVRTYIQSGNVVFRASQTLARRLPTRMAVAIADRFDLRVPVIVRSARRLGDIVRHNPFLNAGADPVRLSVAFLADKPTAASIGRVDPDRSATDEFVVRSSEIYLHYPNGVARSKLTNAYFDSALGTTSTVRNWRTVLALLEMAG